MHSGPLRTGQPGWMRVALRVPPVAQPPPRAPPAPPPATLRSIARRTVSPRAWRPAVRSRQTPRARGPAAPPTRRVGGAWPRETQWPPRMAFIGVLSSAMANRATDVCAGGGTGQDSPGDPLLSGGSENGRHRQARPARLAQDLRRGRCWGYLSVPALAPEPRRTGSAGRRRPPAAACWATCRRPAAVPAWPRRGLDGLRPRPSAAQFRAPH